MEFLTILICFALSCDLFGMTLADHKCKAVSNVDKMADKEMFLAMTDALKSNAGQLTNALISGLAMAASGARKTDKASVRAPEKLKGSLVDISEQLSDEEGTAGDDEVSPPIVPQATMTDVLELQGRQQSSTILDERM